MKKDTEQIPYTWYREYKAVKFIEAKSRMVIDRGWKLQEQEQVDTGRKAPSFAHAKWASLRYLLTQSLYIIIGTKLRDIC